MRYSDRMAPVATMCQCGRPDCRQDLLLSEEEWRTAHRDPDLLVVAPGHVDPGSAEIVSRTPGYWLVRRTISRDEVSDESFPASDPPPF